MAEPGTVNTGTRMANAPKFYDEMYGRNDTIRAPYQNYDTWFSGEEVGNLRRKSAQAEALFRLTGITFNVYGMEEETERLIPFDIVPRIITAKEWSTLEKGIDQRVRAINSFLHDIYHRQEIVRAGPHSGRDDRSE